MGLADKILKEGIKYVKKNLFDDVPSVKKRLKTGKKPLGDVEKRASIDARAGSAQREAFEKRAKVQESLGQAEKAQNSKRIAKEESDKANKALGDALEIDAVTHKMRGAGQGFRKSKKGKIIRHFLNEN
jgi:hypothetical protein